MRHFTGQPLLLSRTSQGDTNKRLLSACFLSLDSLSHGPHACVKFPTASDKDYYLVTFTYKDNVIIIADLSK